MPMSSNQLAALVERARLRSPPVVRPSSPPTAPQRSAPPPRATPAPDAPPVVRPTLKADALRQTKAGAVVPPPPAAPPSTPSPEQAAITETDNCATGWVLKKESWHFHRRFFAIFKRPMRHGEYSHVLWQIRRRTAEHLWEDCWRVTLPDGKTLPIRAMPWRLPKHWQPPQVAGSANGSPIADSQTFLQPFT